MNEVFVALEFEQLTAAEWVQMVFDTRELCEEWIEKTEKKSKMYRYTIQRARWGTEQ